MPALLKVPPVTRFRRIAGSRSLIGLNLQPELVSFSLLGDLTFDVITFITLFTLFSYLGTAVGLVSSTGARAVDGRLMW